ncbi:MAG: hypothetical protein LLG20_18055 [Acidobacteriales bacterium]|nr:hypothetical protein [Terriglobales bacterium]
MDDWRAEHLISISNALTLARQLPGEGRLTVDRRFEWSFHSEVPDLCDGPLLGEEL